MRFTLASPSTRKLRVMRRLFLAALALLVFSLLLAGEMLTQPATRPVGAPPAELHARSVAIAYGDGQFVRGWLAPGQPGEGIVLLLHGVRSDRRQMLARARFLQRNGYTSLLLDLPAHGESSGDRISFGLREAAGVRAALAYLRRQYPRERLGVIGVSLGAASLVLAHPHPAPDAVVLESMYPAIADATRDRIAIRLGSTAASALAPLLLGQLPLWVGVRPAQLRPIDAIRDLHAPVLIASGTVDRHTRIEETERIFAAASAPKRLWEVPGAAHVDLQRFAPAAYERTTLDFLRTHLRPTPASR